MSGYITQKELKKLLKYDPLTGSIVWKVSFRNKINIGDTAGCLCSQGYRKIKLNQRVYAAHQLVWLYMTGVLHKGIDHIDQNKSNNTWANLRKASCIINGKNRKINTNNTSGFNGVCYITGRKKWKAQYRDGNKVVSLGLFLKKEDAISARKKANKEQNFHKNHGKTVI